MNALFWNVRGITTPGRKTCLSELILKTHATVLGFQEIKKESLSSSFLKSIVNNRLLDWHLLPAIGSAGGILMGIDPDHLDVLNWEHGSFYVACHVKIKLTTKNGE